MFTGLVEEVGRLRSIEPAASGSRLAIDCEFVRSDAKLGDSICVEGACLTVEVLAPWGFSCYASPETLARTTLGSRSPGDRLNLERSLALGQRLGGHLVSGHVDGTGHLDRADREAEGWRVRIAAPAAILRGCVPKGSIAVDGISLTIASLDSAGFEVSVIPETWDRTTLRHRERGAAVNLETDLLGKYVYRFLETRGDGAAPTDARLSDLLSRGGWGTR